MAVDPRTAGRWAPILPARGGAMPKPQSHVKLEKPTSHVKTPAKSHVKAVPESHVKNVQLIKRGFEAFNKGDIATLTELLDENCIQSVPGNNRLSGEYKGRDNILKM